MKPEKVSIAFCSNDLRDACAYAHVGMEGSQWLRDVGRIVRERRKAEGYTRQSKLAEDVGVSTDTIGRLERGESVALDVIESVARAIRVDPRQIAGCGIELETARIGDEEREVIDVYRRASRKDRMTVRVALGLPIRDETKPGEGHVPTKGRRQAGS